MSDVPIVFIEREARAAGFWAGFLTGIGCCLFWAAVSFGLYLCS
jgi:hypothetical protein